MLHQLQPQHPTDEQNVWAGKPLMMQLGQGTKQITTAGPMAVVGMTHQYVSSKPQATKMEPPLQIAWVDPMRIAPDKPR